MRIIPCRALCLFVAAGCTFPIKNDLDSGDTGNPLSEYGTIDTRLIPGCNAGNLWVNVSVKNGSGVALESNRQGSPAVLWAEIGNQCEGESLEIEQSSSCMVESWEIDPPDADPTTYEFVCDPEPSQWTLQSGQLRRQQVATVTDLPVGSYIMEVTFGHTKPGTADKVMKSADLTVVPKDS